MRLHFITRIPAITLTAAGLICCAVPGSAASKNLTGEWRSNSGGIYDIWQHGSMVEWEAYSPEDAAFTRKFEGTVRGNIVSGNYRDHPPGNSRGSGQLTFEIVDGRLVRETDGGGFADRELVFIGAYRTPPYPESGPQALPVSPGFVFGTSRQSADLDLDHTLDTVLVAISSKWLVNNYVAGSVFDSTVEERAADGTSATVFGRFKYKESYKQREAWVRVHVAHEAIDCVEFSIFPGRCDPQDTSPNLALNAAAAGLTVALGLHDIASNKP